jgi:ribokinase
MLRPAQDLQVVVVGSANFDFVVKAGQLPREGETVLVSNLNFFSGGKGANQAVAVARLGGKASFLGAVGSDMIGDFLLQGLLANGVDTRCVKRDPVHATGCAFIMLLPSGDNCIAVEPGANFCLTPADIERAKDVIERADALSTVLEIPLEVVEAALRLARKAGKLTVLDAGPPRHCPLEILTLADVVSPNETELAYLAGEEVSGRVSACEAAEKLLTLGVQTMVLKLGSDGSMLVTEKKSKHFPACKINAVDPTGAGDAFTAALTVELAAGRDIERAIRFANCAGALAAGRMGAQPSLPTRLEVEQFEAKEAKA